MPLPLTSKESWIFIRAVSH